MTSGEKAFGGTEEEDLPEGEHLEPGLPGEGSQPAPTRSPLTPGQRPWGAPLPGIPQ